MLPTLTVETFPDLSVKESVAVDTAVHDEAFNKIRKGTARLPRDDWQTLDASLNRSEDVLRLDGPSGETLIRGRFDRLNREGTTREVTVASAEKDVIETPPVPPVTFDGIIAFPGSVGRIVLDESPTVAAPPGSFSDGGLDSDAIDQHTVGNASRGEIAREQLAQFGDEVRFENEVIEDIDGDLVFEATVEANSEESLADVGFSSGSVGIGSKRNITVSPDNQNIIGDLTIVSDERLSPTHIRALGAGRGPKQVTAESQIDSYSGGRKRFATVTDRNINTQPRLQGLANTLVKEIELFDTFVEVEATVVDEDLNRGDFVTLKLPEEGIDQRVRVVELREIFDEEGARQRVTLSTRRRLRPSEREKQVPRATQQYQRANESFLTERQETSGFDTIGSGEVQRLSIYDFPELIASEERVDLLVEGRASANGNFPGGVDVTVNGTTIDTISGGSQFLKRFDLRGDLNPGTNLITASPNSKGDLNLSLSVELRRRGDTPTRS